MAVESTFHKTHSGKTYNKASALNEQSDYIEWSNFSYDIIYTSSPVRLTSVLNLLHRRLHIQVTGYCKHSICNSPVSNCMVLCSTEWGV